MQKIIREEWFPTPIWWTDYKFNLKEIEKFCIDYSKKNQSVFKSNHGGWQSDILNLKEKNIVTDALKVLEKDCSHYLKNDYGINKPISINSSWININNFGHSNLQHTHPGSIISGCLYITSPDKESKIKFISPKRLQEAYEYSHITELNHLTFRTADYENTPNRVLFFPSWLEHLVLSNTTKKPRISIAFNLN